jgi:hypothetical protein
MATPISRTAMAKVIANGNNPLTATNPPAHSICQIKLDKIVNKM